MKLLKQIKPEILAQMPTDDIENIIRITGIERAHITILNMDLETKTIAKKHSEQTYLVGDWAILSNGILSHLVQENSLSRLNNGIEQKMMSNIDELWVFTSANSDLNFNRLDRYITLCDSQQIEPVIIVNKIDLIDSAELSELRLEMQKRFCKISIFYISTTQDVGIEELISTMSAHKTVSLLGSSGVGKSTFTNRVLNNNSQNIQEIGSTDKGRHTTTNRKMFFLEELGFFIDNPGIRTVGLFKSDSNHHSSKFNDCKFSDCQHTDEPGCEVLKQLSKRFIDQEEYKNIIKLQNELLFAKAKDDILLQQKIQNDWKQRSKNIKRSKK